MTTDRRDQPKVPDYRPPADEGRGKAQVPTSRRPKPKGQ